LKVRGVAADLPELPVSNAGACAIDFSMAEFMDDN
jgi:hypothetical protein